MTLLRQLIVVIVTMFLLLFAGTFAINVNNTRDFLNSQLQTVSQDMATSLGLTMSPHMVKNEMAVIESMVDAVFDSGYYREVVVADVHGKILIERVQPLSEDIAPAWFVKMIPLETPRGEGLIMNGWQQGGVVRISASPEFAYVTLWNSAVYGFFWFLGASIVVLLLGMLALYYMLRPLRAVETQAKAICDREYPVQAKLPWTIELRSVVEAMNLLSTKVKEMFSDQSATIDRLRNDSYRDEVTGVSNRRYFEMRLHHLIASRDEFGPGALIFIEVANIATINERFGYQQGNALLRDVGQMIHQQIEQSGMAVGFVSRLSGPCFAAVVTCDPNDTLAFVQSLSASLSSLRNGEGSENREIGHIGYVLYRGQSFSQLMSEADMALRSAQIKGANAYHQYDHQILGDYGALSATEWAALLRKTIAQQAGRLWIQPVMRADNFSSPVHHEIFLRLHGEDDKIIPASLFMPLVSKYGLSREFDMMVITKTFDRLLKEGRDLGKVAINLLPSSLSDLDFIDWLHSQLVAQPDLAQRVLFEVSSYAIERNLNSAQPWIRRIVSTGAEVGIDHFGRGFVPMDYLSTFKVSYVKIDGSFIRGIDLSRDNQSFVESIANIAHGMGISVIAESIETEAEAATVRNLRVDGVQGYGIGRPEEWGR